MPNSNRGWSGRGTGTITVIEEPVMRSYRRKAKIVFHITWVIVGLLAATVAASKWHPIPACWAWTATAEPASGSNAAYIRMDIKRRDALTERVRSPLLALITPATPARDHDTAPAPTALELADVTEHNVTPASRPARPGRKPHPAATLPAVQPAADDDISDWL